MAALSFGSSRISAGMVVTARRGRRCGVTAQVRDNSSSPLIGGGRGGIVHLGEHCPCPQCWRGCRRSWTHEGIRQPFCRQNACAVVVGVNLGLERNPLCLDVWWTYVSVGDGLTLRGNIKC